MSDPTPLRPVLSGLVLLPLLLLGPACHVPPAPASAPETVASSPGRLRVAAEWEPALGVLVSWPPYLPAQLFVEIAADSRLFVRVADEAGAADASAWFERWGIASDAYDFLLAPGADDAAWTRDYGPIPIVTAAGELVLGDARYDLSTPDSALACDAPLKTPWNGGWGDRFRDYDVVADDAAPTLLAGLLGRGARDLPFVFTGGNALVDGQGGALSTCVLVNENQGNGLGEGDLRAALRDELGIERWGVIPNFEDDGIQHIDCLLKLLDPERLLVARPPPDHPLYDRYQQLVDDHLSMLRTPSGRPYEILRLDTAPFENDGLAAYTNALILNGVVYVPLFGIAQDATALEQWQDALPGHRIRGIPFVLADEPALPARARRMYPGRLGWRSFDALHCRTRAVWDPGMLHIGVEHPPHGASEPVVTADIVALSGASLLADSLRLRWRRGDEAWQDEPLERGVDGRFRGHLPRGEDTEYYLTAADTSGRREAAPRTAPTAGFRWSSEP